MPDTPARSEILSLPKVELHVHLGGTIREELAVDLANRHGVEPSSGLRMIDGRYPRKYADFPHFLDTFLASNALVRTPDDLALVASEFAKRQTAEGIVWSEVIFTAMIYVRNGMEPSDMWAALREGFASAGPGIGIGIVVDAIRDLGRSEAEATIRVAADADAPIVGLCLTGIEGAVPMSEFTLLRDTSTSLGIGLEVHAGEMGPPSSIVEALDVLGADRIGHGVTAIEDPDLMTRLARDQVPLDVCPSSNVAIGLFPSLEEHPMTRFWEEGLNVTISSDDPPFFATTLTDELSHFARVAGLSLDDLTMLQRRAMENSFAASHTKQAVLGIIDEWSAGM